MRNFQELSVWQKSHELTLKIYKISSSFPKDELLVFPLKSGDLHPLFLPTSPKAAVVTAMPRLKRFLVISAGSCSELDYQVLLAKDLGYIPETTFNEVTENIISIRKMLYSFIKHLASQNPET